MQNHALKSNKSRNKFILCIESATIQIVYGKREFYHIAQLENDLNVVAPENRPESKQKSIYQHENSKSSLHLNLKKPTFYVNFPCPRDKVV